MSTTSSPREIRFSLYLIIKAIWLFAGVLLLLSASGSQAYSQGKGQTRVVVHLKGISYVDGMGRDTPIAGAKVELRDTQNARVLTTDATGNAESSLPPGSYRLTVTIADQPEAKIDQVGINYLPSIRTASVSPDQLGNVTVEVKSEPGNVDSNELFILMRPGAEPEKPFPIIFLPGVAGTEIWQPWNRPDGGMRIWPFRTLSGVPGDRFNMMLDRDGRRNANGRVVIGDILRSWPTNFYGGMIAFLTSKGYNEYNERDTEEERKRSNLFILPYDWRLDLDSEDHFNRLDQIIDLALKNSGAKKVILLAHSMGGVIARAYLISRPASAAKVDSLVSMGTPYWGSVKPYYGLVDGYDFGNSFVFNKTMKILARNFPAAHFLLPRLPFIVDTNGQELSLDESFSVQYKGYIKGPGGIDDYTESDALIWNINAVLLERARKFWTRMGPVENPTAMPSGVRHYVIVGYGNRTMDGYKLVPATDDDYVAIGARRVKAEPLWGDGDITVPLKLAQIKTATAEYYVKFKVGVFGSKIVASSEHGDLPSHPTVQNIVWQIIEGKPPEKGIYDYLEPSRLQSSEYVDFTLHSDANLSITDEDSGGRMGFNSEGGIDQTLPTGSFVAIGKAEYASLVNVSNRYQVTVDGIRAGKFTLEINIGRGGNTLARFYYPEVSVRQGTRAQLNLSPTQAASSPPPLTVTTDGRTTTIPANLGTARGPVILGVPPVSTAPIPRPPSSGGIGGTWATPSGDTITLTQDGNRITGTYRGILGTGTLAGTFDGRTLTGTIEGGQAGITLKDTFSLSLTPDGRLEGRLGSSIFSVDVILTRRP